MSALTQATPTALDVIIVGGGILGLLTARELAIAGARITLLERQQIGQESSWAGGGILSPLYPWRAPEPINALCRWSQAFYPELAEQLKAGTDVDPEWTQCGMLVSDCEDIEQALGWCATHSIRHARLEREEFSSLEPELSILPHHPLLLPDVAQIRNPRLIRALRADLTQRGVELLEQHEVTAIDIEQGRVRRLRTNQGAFDADRYVIASGGWSGLLGQTIETDLPVMPVKGQMLVFAGYPGLLRHIVLCGGHYLIPRRDGRILAGSTVEHTQFDKSTTESARKALEDFAYASLPALRNCALEKHWAGLRPGSPEGIPFIGGHPEISNLFFNCGHFRNGFVMAPASAHLLAELMLDRPPSLIPEPYRIPLPH